MSKRRIAPALKKSLEEAAEMESKKLVYQLKLQRNIEVPFEVWALFGENCKTITIAGNQASFGEDYAELAQLRKAIEWYADQLGGKIKWEKN